MKKEKWLFTSSSGTGIYSKSLGNTAQMSLRFYLAKTDVQNLKINWKHEIQKVMDDLQGQSYNTFYTLGRCKIKCLNGSFHLQKWNLINMLGCGVLRLWPKNVVPTHHFNSLGCILLVFVTLLCCISYRIMTLSTK